MTKILNFALKSKGGGREVGTCGVLRPCHPPKFETCTKCLKNIFIMKNKRCGSVTYEYYNTSLTFYCFSKKLKWFKFWLHTGQIWKDKGTKKFLSFNLPP